MFEEDLKAKSQNIIRSLIGIGVLVIAIAMLYDVPQRIAFNFFENTQSTIELSNNNTLITPALYALEAGPKRNAKEKISTLVGIVEEDSSLFSQGRCPSGNLSGNENKFFLPVNKINAIGDVVPTNLVEIQNVIPTKGGRLVCMDETASIYLKKMFDVAEESGYRLIVTSGHRTFDTQFDLYRNGVDRIGFDATRRIAPPGYSEHHIGTAVDLSAQSLQQASAVGSFGDSPEGRWVRANEHRFGFIQSYESGKENITGYITESWHKRFIGVENATRIVESGLTLHEVLTNKNLVIEEGKTYGSEDFETDIAG